ncbi:MAG: glutamate 5-kinase [Planctomycetota bacterium]|nr:glutamate 5-kinase [Planctomycetota bacterium]
MKPHNLCERVALNKSARNIVVKIGSRLLTRNGLVDSQRIQQLASQICRLSGQNRNVTLVSSGAVGTAMTLLNTDRPVGLGRLQAYAAIGQAELIHHYNMEFEKHGKRAAQVLLTIDDMTHRQRYLNLRNTIFSLFELNAIPVINENDCVATEEISLAFGDNDQLAAKVAMLVDADLLIILSDVDGLYDRDPQDTRAKRISFVQEVDLRIKDMVETKHQGQSFSKGGMKSKINAAKIATSVGIPTIIAGGQEPEILHTLIQGNPVGTYFAASEQSTNSRKRWIKSSIEITGKVIVDAGAEKAICEKQTSLLPIGAVEVHGAFNAGDLISVSNLDGRVIAKGISNFDHLESKIVLGLHSNQLDEKLGRAVHEELIHRDNLVLV